MSLIAAFAEFTQSQDWETHYSEDGSEASVSVALEWGDGELYLRMAANNDLHKLSVLATYPSRVPEDRIAPVARLLNRIHSRLDFGNFSFDEFEPMQPVRFSSALEAEGAEIRSGQMEVFARGILEILDHYFPVIADVAMNGRDLDEAWYEFVAVNYDKACSPEYYEEEAQE